MRRRFKVAQSARRPRPLERDFGSRIFQRLLVTCLLLLRAIFACTCEHNQGISISISFPIVDLHLPLIHLIVPNGERNGCCCSSSLGLFEAIRCFVIGSNYIDCNGRIASATASCQRISCPYERSPRYVEACRCYIGVIETNGNKVFWIASS